VEKQRMNALTLEAQKELAEKTRNKRWENARAQGEAGT